MSKSIRFGQFEWDDKKEKRNVEKHQIDFKQAAQVFLDENRLAKREANL